VAKANRFRLQRSQSQASSAFTAPPRAQIRRLAIALANGGYTFLGCSPAHEDDLQQRASIDLANVRRSGTNFISACMPWQYEGLL
jgi:hypothetical protein